MASAVASCLFTLSEKRKEEGGEKEVVEEVKEKIPHKHTKT